MGKTPFKSLELKQCKTYVKIKPSARKIQASNLNPVCIQKVYISIISKCSICWVWISLSLVSVKSKNCCLCWLQLEYLLIF